MNYEFEIQEIKKQLNNLQNSFLQAQRNQVPITNKVDNTANEVKVITPYTETKTAYIGDTEITFSGVKEGNLSVFLKNDNGDYPNYTIERNNDTLTVYFEPLEYVTQITISIS